MLNKNIFFDKFDELLNFYPSWTANFSKASVVKTWYERFNHMNDRSFIKMVDKYVDTNRYPPTVAGLMECYVQLPNNDISQKEVE